MDRWLQPRKNSDRGWLFSVPRTLWGRRGAATQPSLGRAGRGKMVQGSVQRGGLSRAFQDKQEFPRKNKRKKRLKEQYKARERETIVKYKETKTNKFKQKMIQI